MACINVVLSLFFLTAVVLQDHCFEAAPQPAVCSPTQEENFIAHKKKFNKNYEDLKEETERKSIWCSTDNYITAHNAKDASYKLEHNWLSDKTSAELAAMNGYKDPEQIRAGLRRSNDYCVSHPPPPVTWPVPDSVNWTAEGVVVEPRNQGDCGSCYAFASVAAVEAKIQIETGVTLDLSREDVIDCSTDYYNFYCAGGTAVGSFSYITDNGLYNTSDYPYTSGDIPNTSPTSPGCKQLHQPLALPPKEAIGGFSHQYILNKFSNTTCLYTREFGLNNAGDEELLKQFVAKQPVFAAINGQVLDFIHYKSGVLSIDECSPQLNHAVLIVGYGHDVPSNKDYWIIKNSWGGWPNCQMDNEGNWVVCEEGWGQGGYALIERGNNMCGIATDALIPTFSEISPPATTTEDIRDKR